ncbi:organic cation transporter protein [Anabrus simplex]|uniref:organic cation transporter protein n=1 Tax=Anabrus simplex TaxID=316456 RepID=UPI0034DD709D
MVFDDVFLHLGDFGRYQKRIYFLLCLPGIPVALHKLVNVFLHANPHHRCLLPFEYANTTYTLPPQLLNMSYPWDDSNNEWSSCERLDANFSTDYFSQGVPENHSIGCNSWVYDKSTYKSSAVTEFNLVCNNAWLKATADAIFMLGDLLGSIIFGDLSDRFGRKPIFFFSLVLQVVAGLLASLAQEYVSFMITRMIIGATTAGVFLVAYVIAMEMVGPSKRLLAGVLIQLFFTLGYLLTGLFAYFIRDWRLLQCAVSVPGLVFLCYWWFIPESARWLITKGRSEEARKVLLKAADENKVIIPKGLLDDVVKQTYKNEETQAITQRSTSLVDLVRYPNLRKKSNTVFFIWFVNSCTYYGLSWNTSNLGGNDFVNFILAGLVEFPAYVLLMLTLNRWGRKLTQCGSMILGGVALLLTLTVPQDMLWLTITFVMIGKMAITASFATIYIFSAELFPTVLRNVGIGASSTFARVGGMSAPYINLLSHTWQPLPQLTFGALTFMAGLLALILPETMNKTLPDTVEEGERFGKKEKQVKPASSDTT